MKQLRKKPAKTRQPGIRPERLAKIRNPEIFRRNNQVEDFQDLLKSKATKSQQEFQARTDAVAVLSNLSQKVVAVAQAAVKLANQAETTDEKLVVINQGLIDVVKTCEIIAENTKGAVHRFQAEVNLITEILNDLEPPPTSVPEEPVKDNVSEESEIEDTIEPTE